MSGIIGRAGSKSKIIGRSKDTAKAWVSFNGQGTVGTTPSVESSFNVSSLTDESTGSYTVTFASALSNANYCVTGSGAGAGHLLSSSTRATTSVRVDTAFSSSASNYDNSWVSVAIFGS